MLETQKEWWKPAWGVLGWWIGFWNLIGAFGFTVSLARPFICLEDCCVLCTVASLGVDLWCVWILDEQWHRVRVGVGDVLGILVRFFQVSSLRPLFILVRVLYLHSLLPVKGFLDCERVTVLRKSRKTPSDDDEG